MVFQVHPARMVDGDYVKGHIDNEDGMCQLIITFGTFTGSLLWVRDAKGKVSTIDTKHGPTIVEGDYAMVFYRSHQVNAG